MQVSLVQIQGVSKTFYPRRGQAIEAVSDITLDIKQGETLGLVGESGCGKTTLGMLVIGLCHPSAGRILYCGSDIHGARGEQKYVLRRNMQMIFQDPRMSLNPCMNIGESIGEGLDIHGLAKGAVRQRHIEELLRMVGLGPHFYDRFPHELSGGQRQRVGIARALAVRPRFLVCDEPLSALDVSIQAQIVNLLRDLQRRLNLTLLFIAHNLIILRYIADRIAVMLGGRIVESAPREELYTNPLHPYTRALMNAIPLTDPARRRQFPACFPHEKVAPRAVSSGCVFHPLCPQKLDVCLVKTPPQTVTNGHYVACWREY